MKKLTLLILSGLLAYTSLSAQTTKFDEPASNSKAIKFMQSSGMCITKEFYDLSAIKGVSCQVLIITNIINSQKTGCLRLETSHYSPSSYSADTYIGTLDYEEIDACIKSLLYIKDQLLPSTPSVYTEAEYKTSDNVKIGAFYSIEKLKWSAFVYTKGYTSRSAVFIDSASIDTLIETMKNAKNMIAEKIK